MKLCKSIARELVLLSRSYYFYIELFMAALSLVLLMMVMPENLNLKSTEYYHFQMPQAIFSQLERTFFPKDGSIQREETTLKVDGKEVPAIQYSTDTRNAYVVDSEETLQALSRDTGNIGISIGLKGLQLTSHYYLQGYETAQFKNLAALLFRPDMLTMVDTSQHQPVRFLETEVRTLSNRQNLLSTLLVVSSTMMGIFIMAAYVFDDKKTNIISALRVTPAPVFHYIVSKMAAVLLIALLSALVVALPVMKGSINYLVFILFISSASFLSIALGALLSSYFQDMEGAFAAVFIAMIVFFIPAIGQMFPSFQAAWLRYIPSTYIMEGMRYVLTDTNRHATLLYSLGFLVGGSLLTLFSLYRYQQKGGSHL